MIKEIVEIPPVFGEPIIFTYGGTGFVKGNYKYHYPETWVAGSGKAYSRPEAYQKCLSEIIEHICAFELLIEDLPLTSWKDLKEKAVHPEDLPSYSLSQFQQSGFICEPFTEKTRVRWIKGSSLTEREDIWVPYQYVKIYRQRLEDEPLIFWGNSSGHAAGVTLEQALLAGIYEVIERDAFTLLWLNKLTMPKIDLEQPPDHPLAILFKEKFNKIHLIWKVVDMTTDLRIPAFLVTLRQKYGKGPPICVSSSAGLDSNRALQHALLDAACLRNSLIRSPEKNKKEILHTPIKEAFQRVKTFEDHVALTFREDFQPYVSFLDSSSMIRDLNSLINTSTGNLAQDLEQVVSILKNKGYQVIYVDITNEEADQQGLKVAKVIIPGLQPLHSGYLMETLKNKRLYDYLYKMGLSPKPTAEKDLFRVPHPFS